MVTALLAASLIASGQSAEAHNFNKTVHELHVETVNEDASGCTPDPLGLLKRSEVAAAIRGYNLTSIKIRLLGCSSHTFLTQPDGSVKVGHAYKIFYSVDPNRTPAEYIAPLIHELGHVYQSERAGSFRKLLDTQCILRIELGADYLSGLIYKNVLMIKPPDWEDNLSVFGDFEIDNDQFHGDPGLRVAAFRFGYFEKWEEKGRDVGTIYDQFQNWDLRHYLYQQFGSDDKCDI